MRTKLMRWTLSLVAAATIIAPAAGAEPALRSYYLDTTLMSIIPDVGLPSLKRSGAVNGSSGSTLGSWLKSDTRSFGVNTKVVTQQGRFLAFVTVTPDKTDSKTKASETRFDLTDLRPQTFEIARDEDGRVYQLCLVPTVREYPGPKLFDAREFRLEELNFPNSPVVLNDQDYLGSLGVSGAQLASIELPGVGNLELSLLHMKDAEPLGQLQHGVLTIRHDKETLTISNVSNGSQRQILDGGPYQVWVRWKPPTQTAEEFQNALRAEIAELKKQAESGNSKVPDDLLQRLKELDLQRPPRFLSCGARVLTKDELVPAK